MKKDVHDSGTWLKIVVLVLSSVWSASAQRTSIKLDTQQSRIDFVLGDVLHTVRGTFSLTRGDLWFDPQTGTAGGLLIVSAASGNSGSHARDSRMQKNILESQLYPTVSFTPSRLEGKVNLPGESEFQLQGQFAIHGAKHDLAMQVKTHIAGDHVTADTKFEVPYVTWGMKNPSTFLLRVNEIVQIEVQATGRIAPAP